MNYDTTSTRDSTTVRRIDSEERWRQLEDCATTVYSTWEWGTVCEQFGHERQYLGAEQGGELVGGLPMMYNGSRLFGNELVSMPYAPYGELLVSDDADRPDAVTAALLNEAKSLSDRLGAEQTSIRGIGSGVVVPDFEPRSNFVTFELDLSGGEDEAWDAVASRFRRSVRKARKNDVTVERGFDRTTFSQYYEMYLDNMQYYGTPPYSRQFFRNVNRLLGQRDSFEMYTAYDEDGEPINGVTAFFFGERAIYWTGVTDYDYRELNGGSLLLWEAIVDSCERGYPVFDLGRTREDTGVYDYKKSIGEPVELTDHFYAPRGDVGPPDPEAEKYDKYKSAWQKLPQRATEYIGPHIRSRLSM